jgi:hypothetical protein
MPGTALRFVTYLAPDLLGRVPLQLVSDWPAEDTCTPVSALVEEIEDPEERGLLLAEVHAFEADLLAILRRELLPRGEILPHVFLGLGGGFQLVSQRGNCKVRADGAGNVAIVRRVPLELDPEQPRVVQLRHELKGIVPFALGGADRKPIQARVTEDLGDVEPGAVYVEFAAPRGTGFHNGRFKGLRVYSDGKITLLGFQTTEVKEQAYVPIGRPGTATEADGLEVHGELLPPPVGPEITWPQSALKDDAKPKPKTRGGKTGKKASSDKKTEEPTPATGGAGTDRKLTAIERARARREAAQKSGDEAAPAASQASDKASEPGAKAEAEAPQQKLSALERVRARRRATESAETSGD